MKWTLNPRANGRIEFLCQDGVGHYPCWYDCAAHGCDGCCKDDSFPGRLPRAGDLALCGLGSLGIITFSDKQAVTYADGHQTMAWIGLHMTDVVAEKGSEWSSRNPIIVGTLLEMYDENVPLGRYVRRKMRNIDGVKWKTCA